MGQGVTSYIAFFSLAGESEGRASDTRLQPRGVESLVESVVNDVAGVVDTLLGVQSAPIGSFRPTTPLPPASSPTTTPTISTGGTSSSTPTSTPPLSSSQSTSISQSSTVVGSSTSPSSSPTSASTSVSSNPVTNSITSSISSSMSVSQTTSLSSTLTQSSTSVSVDPTTSQPGSVTESATGSTSMSMGHTTSMSSPITQSTTGSSSVSVGHTSSVLSSIQSTTGSPSMSVGQTTSVSNSITQSTTGSSSVSVSHSTSLSSSAAESMTSPSSSSITSSSLSSSVILTSSSISASNSLSHSSVISTSLLTASTSLGISSSSQPSQSLTTTASAATSSLFTDSLSSAPPSTGAGTSRSSSLFSTGRSTVRTSQTSTRTASSEAPGGTSDIGTTSSGALPGQPTHLSTILSILLSLLFFIFLLGFIYLCRRRQLKRGMNIFGQRLELGETPGAWQRLSEAGGRNHVDKNEMIPGKLEKRSMLTVAASVAGRVGLPANRSTAKYISNGKHNRSGSNDSESLREARIPFGAAFQNASSSLDPPLTPPTSRSHISSLLSSVPFTFYRSPATSSRGTPVLDVPITASNTGSHVSDENVYFDNSNSTLNLELEDQLQSGSQHGFIPLLHDNFTNSSFLDMNGMGYIPVIRQNFVSDSYSRIDAYVPGTPSSFSSTRTSHMGDSETNLPHNTSIENASQVSRSSQESRNTQDTYDTQGSMSTTSSLSFARPAMVRSTTSAEVPLITSTFHYSPDGDDDEDVSGGSRFAPNFQQLQTMTEANAGSFFRSMEWRRRAAAYADRTGQRPSLMEVVEVHFASNTDSSTAARDGRSST